MWIVGLIFAVVGLGCLTCIIVSSYSAGYQKAKKEKIKDLSKVLWTIGIVLLGICIPVFWLITVKHTVRQRLNEPITSEMQLYGYKVIDRRYFKGKASFYSPEKSKYFIDIWDLLPTCCGMFPDVEVSEEIYKKTEVGKSYLPEDDPNALTPQQDQ